MLLKFMVRLLRTRSNYIARPLSADVLSIYLRKRNYPSWTAFFVPYRHIQDEFFGHSHFNFDVDGENYHILRTGCYPYVKFHCTKRPVENLHFEDKFYSILKVINLGVPCLGYGIAGIFLAKHKETVVTVRGTVPIYFWIKEEHQ